MVDQNKKYNEVYEDKAKKADNKKNEGGYYNKQASAGKDEAGYGATDNDADIE